jgi:PAS domain S-box-containing protein
VTPVTASCQGKEDIVHMKTCEASDLREGRKDRAVTGSGRNEETAKVLLSRIAWEWTATFDTMSDLISIIDGDFRFTRVNRALADHLQREPKDLIGLRCYELMHGCNEPWPDCPHRQAVEERRSVTREIVDDHIGIPLLVTCAPFYDGLGRLIGTVHVSRDISEQKRSEKAREKLITYLQEALSQVKRLSGLLPICAACKKIRDDRGYWQQIEEYIRQHSEADFSHGICPACEEELYPDPSNLE